eukprot:GHVU01234768.1.p3 GENE.GHVU01234768.1~~GHVU01234768.1.p3  ORF type:complete len:168 (+),score=34.32 GHVU01234768.1:1420-1923(+)
MERHRLPPLVCLPLLLLLLMMMRSILLLLLLCCPPPAEIKGLWCRRSLPTETARRLTKALTVKLFEEALDFDGFHPSAVSAVSASSSSKTTSAAAVAAAMAAASEAASSSRCMMTTTKLMQRSNYLVCVKRRDLLAFPVDAVQFLLTPGKDDIGLGKHYGMYMYEYV